MVKAIKGNHVEVAELLIRDKRLRVLVKSYNEGRLHEVVLGNHSILSELIDSNSSIATLITSKGISRR